MNKTLDLKNFRKIAIIQTAFIGDVALALYFAEDIKKLNSDCEITFITTPVSYGLVKCTKAVDNAILFDKREKHSGLKGIKYISSILKEQEIDLIFGLQRSLRTSLITSLAKPKFSIGFSKSDFSFLYKNRVKYIQGYHEVERNASLLSIFLEKKSKFTNINTSFNLRNVNFPLTHRDFLPWGVELEISDDDKLYVEDLYKRIEIQNKDKLIAIAPGSVWETKRWLSDYFEILVKDMIASGYKPVLIGSSDDLPLCNHISQNTNSKSIAGLTTIPQLLYFLSNCKLTITNDSAPTHLAGLVKCPVITIFGATIPELGFYPLGPDDISIEIDDLKCRPCGIHGGKMCPIKTFDCMAKLRPEKLISEYKALLNKLSNE